jgi:hypothetical protein
MHAMATIQPCSACGEETAAGSPLFSERRRIDHADGGRTFLCPICDARASQRQGRRLTDEELERFITSGSLAMIAGLPGVH